MICYQFMHNYIGETKDVIEALKIADSFGIPRFSVVNAVGSAIARQTGVGVYCYAGRENAVASTKAFTSQVTVLSLIAAWFAQLENRGILVLFLCLYCTQNVINNDK